MLEVIDIQAIAGAIGALITAAYIAWKGYSEKQTNGDGQVMAGIIQDNTTMRENTEQLRELRQELRVFNDHVDELITQMKLNQVAFSTFTDLVLRRNQ